MDGVEVSILVSLVQRDTSLTNDNYCISPSIPCQVVVERKSDQTVQHLVQDSLSCQNVVKLPSLNTVQRHSNQTVSVSKSCSICNFKRASAKERYNT